jgi:cell fate (sporulation/competence/biofilm development) regulator YlbF (YheA/YmcA/DUF963 family)
LFPPKLTEVPQQPKLVFGPGRKRALTGHEVVDQIKADRARERRLAEIRELQDQVQNRDLKRRREEQEAQAPAYAKAQVLQEALQEQDNIATFYVTQQSLRDSLIKPESQINPNLSFPTNRDP